VPGAPQTFDELLSLWNKTAMNMLNPKVD
jgi:hypothetical protein